MPKRIRDVKAIKMSPRKKTKPASEMQRLVYEFSGASCSRTRHQRRQVIQTIEESYKHQGKQELCAQLEQSARLNEGFKYYKCEIEEDKRKGIHLYDGIVPRKHTETRKVLSKGFFIIDKSRQRELVVDQPKPKAVKSTIELSLTEAEAEIKQVAT
jgi:hypothetical protein